MDDESKVVTLARKAVEKYVQEGKRIKPPENLPDILKKKSGVFVSLKKNGKLRGCIGTTEAVQKNIAEEIISNAISAASSDPRFSAVKPGELKDLEYSVDILGEKEPVESREELAPDKYGVIVKKGHRSGLLLPDLDGIDTVDEQLKIAKKKAGLLPQQKVEIYRFPVHRYK